MEDWCVFLVFYKVFGSGFDVVFWRIEVVFWRIEVVFWRIWLPGFPAPASQILAPSP